MNDSVLIHREKRSRLKRWALKFGLSSHPDSVALHFLIEDQKKLHNQFKYLEMVSPKYRTEIRDSDKALAHQLLQIANAHGLRYYGSMDAGHLHFGCVYPEYIQLIRIYASGWPKGAEMRLDYNSHNGQQVPEALVRAAVAGYDAAITPPDAMTHKLLDLLAEGQQLRKEFLASDAVK
jgi:hypothetical protein